MTFLVEVGKSSSTSDISHCLCTPHPPTQGLKLCIVEYIDEDIGFGEEQTRSDS